MDKTKNLQILADMLKKLDTKSVMEDFVMAFKTALETLKTLKIANENERAEIQALFEKTIAKIENKGESEIDALKQQINSVLDKALAEQANSLNFIRDSVRNIKNGKDADEEKIVSSVLKRIKLPEQKEVILDDAFAIRNKLEGLNGDERLDKSAVKGIEEIEKLAREKSKAVIGGGISKMAADWRYTKYHGGASNITVGTVEPSNPEVGDLFVDIS